MGLSRRNFLVLSGSAAGMSMAGVGTAAPVQAQPRPSAVVGAPLRRVDGPAKVTGTARYAFEQRVESPLYLHAVRSTIARGRITAIDTADAEAVPGVVVVLTHQNAPRLANTDDAELAVLQSDAVAYRGQFVAAVAAETQEAARHAASLVRVSYAQQRHESELSDSAAEESVHSTTGDVAAAMASAPVTLDQTYTTPMQHNNPMEPHSTIAQWTAGELRLYESTQGAHPARAVLAPIFGVAPEQVDIISPHVGGGFGSKGLPHAPVVLAALTARRTQGRPVKFAVSRQEMFSVVGYRTPTRQRIRLAADAGGRLTAIQHESVEQIARIKEFAEGSAESTAMMYAAANRRFSSRLTRLDVPPTTWMRAPGKCPGVFALEVAMDEMAEACGLDPIEFRVRNEPKVDPENGKPFSSRGLVRCMRDGARRFGWSDRRPRPGTRREGEWLVGLGVASSTYPVHTFPGSVARIRYQGGKYQVLIGAADLGTGAWTTLAQVAADALKIPFEQVVPRIGSTELPNATVAGGSTGMASWGTAVVDAAAKFRKQHGNNPSEGAQAGGTTPDNPDVGRFSMHAFGAQFAEVRVNVDTGEIRVPRMLGVFTAGRIINARTARSQFIGGMTMGLSMALHEHSVMDHRMGHVVNHDFAGYHIAANADVGDIEAVWLDESDPHVNSLGAKGIGEIGIVGTASAVLNAAYNATGIRARDLPLTPDTFLR